MWNRLIQLTTLLIGATVLGLGLDWELPTAERISVLLHEISLSDDDRARLDHSTEEYIEAREAIDLTSRRALEAGRTPEIYTATEIGARLSQKEHYRALRRYIVGSCAVDERKPFIALARMNPSELDFDPRGFMYGGAYLYPMGGLLFVLQKLGVLANTKDISHYVEHPEQIAAAYIPGRVLNVLAFLGIGVLLIMLGERIAGRTAGTVSLMAWMFSTLPLNQALVCKPHVYAAFWVLLGFYWLLRYQDSKMRRDLVVSACASGLGIGSSLVAVVAIAMYPVVLMDRRLQTAVTEVSIACSVCILAFLLTNPYVLINPTLYELTIFQHAAVDGEGFGVFGLGKGLAALRDLLMKSYPFPLSFVAMGCVGFCALRGRGMQGRLSVALGFSLLLLSFTVGLVRQMIFLGAPLCLFAGGALGRRLERCRPGARALVCLFFLGPGALLFGLFARDVIVDKGWYGPTKNWVEEAVLEGKTFGVFDRPEPVNHPPFPFFAREVLNLHVYQGGGRPPDFVVLGNFNRDREDWAAHPLRSEYRLGWTLGFRASFDALLGFRTRSESRVSGWVYTRK